MSTPIAEPNADQNPAPVPTPPAPDAKPEPDSRNAEAAKRRAERNALRDEVETLRAENATLRADAEAQRDNSQRQEVERMLASDDSLPFLHRTADLWDAGGVSIEDLRDEEGNLDPEAVADAVADLAEARPYLIGERPRLLDLGNPKDGGSVLSALMSQQTESKAEGNDAVSAMQKLSGRTRYRAAAPGSPGRR